MMCMNEMENDKINKTYIRIEKKGVGHSPARRNGFWISLCNCRNQE